MFQATEESPRMFESDFLDVFTRVHWAVVPIIYVPVVSYCAWMGVESTGMSMAIPLLVGGFALWTLAEYWLHRTLFHWVPDTSWGPRMHFFLHGVHHDWPDDKYRLVMPPAVSLILLFCVFGPLFMLGFGDFGWALLGGFVAGYLNYDLTHYYVHHAKPKTKRIKRLRAHHMYHHFNDPTKKHGVSFRVWDSVFRTV